jgi:gamma-glutamyl-gamma-aminobutyrate hydrolase PuuD
VSVPRIAVSGVRRHWQGAGRTGVNAVYVDSVASAGAVPVILPPTIPPEHAVHALEGIDGVLLSGGEDIDPMWYCTDPVPRRATASSSPSSPRRVSAGCRCSASVAACSW